MNNHDRR